MLKGKSILATSLSLSAILACCVAVSCNATKHEQQEPSTASIVKRQYIVFVGANRQAFAYGEGKTEKERMRSLVEHSVLSVEGAPYSREYAALHSDKGLLYVVQREDVPGVDRAVARVDPDGSVKVEEE